MTTNLYDPTPEPDTYRPGAVGITGLAPNMTVPDFARLLYWERWVSQEVSEEIADAPTLAAAVQIADRAGVSLPTLPFWDDLEDQLAQEKKGNVAAAAQDRIALVNAEDEARQLSQLGGYQGVAAVRDAIANNLSYVDALELAKQPQPEEQFSAMLLPGYMSGVSEAAHSAQMKSDEYSPWPGRTRAQVVEMAMGPGWNHYEREMRFEGQPVGDKDYWRSQYMSNDYVSGQEVVALAGLSPQERARLERQWVSAGLLDPDGGYVPGAISTPQLKAMRATMEVGNSIGVGYEVALSRMTSDYQAWQRAEAIRARRASRGSGSGRAVFSVPASLRQVPDYESLAQESKNLARQALGRDLEDYEEAILADTLGSKYRERNKVMIGAARAAFNAAQSGRQGKMEFEVPDPQLRTQRFIEERYRPELERGERVEDTAVTNRILIDAITRGSSMVGG